MFKHFVCFLLLPFFSLYADSFETIRPILDLYDRPLSILAIGENDLIYQISNAYPATCVLAGSTNIKRLGTHQTIHLKKDLSFKDLQDLNRREHFDIILAFHSLHELKPWKDSLTELFKLGDHLIIQISKKDTPEARGNAAISDLVRYLTNLGLTIYLDSAENTHLLWYCFKPKSVYPHLYSEIQQKGISLLTYRKHDGSYPSSEWIQAEKKKLPFWKRISKTFIRIDGQSLY